ncbi:hypothetical protein L596_016312 [Steinernema carpocapsae]|uniref:Neurotransmitter-gated ion-channel ligand-binding domain-containing protein n=2 Tax=Steinernema carpocapsae TaxID=34508 RepID=A0A4U5NIL9_STECR|nr:hypothetical protein L596_016312 [Steinernema carpocapsae]
MCCLRLLLAFFLFQISVQTENFILERFTINRSRSVLFEERHLRWKRNVEENKVAANTSFLLNSILKDYDKSFRPNFDKNEPTLVFIDIFVRTMGPISEKTDTYAFDCYFRQTWRDKRLRFQSPNRKILSLGMSMLDKIWKPDTYFWNGQGSYLHTLTTPNRLVRLSEDGVVLYSSRLTVKAKCQMDLMRFPLDIQACRLVIGSFAYGINEMIFRWKVVGENRGVHMDYAALTELPQFEMTGFKVYNSSPLSRDTNYSTLEVRFFLHRHIGYFIINFYIPCTLIVLLSWVALWINREATGDRIGLGITSVLTLTFLSLDSRSDFRVDFPTALDVYILICFVSLLICIVEFTIVHYFTKFNTGDPEIQRSEKERLRNILRKLPKESMLSVGSRHYNRPNVAQKHMDHSHSPARKTAPERQRKTRGGMHLNGL